MYKAKDSIKALILSIFVFTMNISAQEINISGRLLNEEGKPVSQAKVSLMIAGIETTTDATGSFTLIRENTGITSPDAASIKSSFEGNRLILNCEEDQVYVGIFDLSGKEVASLSSNQRLTGTYAVYPGAYLDQEHQTVLIVRTMVGQEIFAFKFLCPLESTEERGLIEISARSVGLKSTEDHYSTLDTLVITHDSYVGKKIPIDCNICSFGDITMSQKVPVAPTNLTGSSESPTSITLSWNDNSEYESGFRIEQATFQLIEWSDFSEVATVGPDITSFTAEGLIQGNTYKYRVCAYNNGGNSPYTGEVIVTTQVANPLSISGPNSSTGEFSIVVTYSWPGLLSSTSDRFELEESTSPTGGFTKIDNSPWGERPTSYTFNLTRTSGTYYYRARAYKLNGFTEYTDVISVSVDTPVQTADLKVVNNTHYPMIDIRLNNQQQVGQGNGILQGDYYTFEFGSSGQVTYVLGVGFWDGSYRNVWFLYSGTTQVTVGTSTTLTFNNPTIGQLLSGFSSYRDWTGEYWDANLNMHYATFRFYSNGAWTFYDDGTQTGSGNVSLVSWPDNAVIVQFAICNGCDVIQLAHPFGQFQLRNGPPSWPIIQYTAQ